MRSRSPRRDRSALRADSAGALGGHATDKAVGYALRHDLAGVAAYFLGRSVVAAHARSALARSRRGNRGRRLGLSTRTRSTSTGGATTEPSPTSATSSASYGPGLSHLPENFVYNNGNEQELTRRLISTFLSPLGAAYLCVVGILLAPRTAPRDALVVLAAAGLLWTHTRAARRSGSPSALSSSPPSVAAPGRSPPPPPRSPSASPPSLSSRTSVRAHTSRRASWRISAPRRRRDGPTRLEPSAESHLSNAVGGIQTVTEHPQGYGLGNAGEVAFARTCRSRPESRTTPSSASRPACSARSSSSRGTSRCSSALVRAREGALAAMFAAVLFVAIQTDAYGIPWLAYCVWWLAASGPRGRK